MKKKLLLTLLALAAVLSLSGCVNDGKEEQTTTTPATTTTETTVAETTTSADESVDYGDGAAPSGRFAEIFAEQFPEYA